MRRTACSACGCDTSDYTVGCRTCTYRASARRRAKACPLSKRPVSRTRLDRVPIERIAPIIRREAIKRMNSGPDGTNTSHPEDRGIMALSAEMAGLDRADDSYARRLYVILNGRDSHGLRRPVRPNEPISGFDQGAGLVLAQNNAVAAALEVQAALDALDVFLHGGNPPETTVLKQGTAYRFVVDNKLMRTITHMSFSTVDEIFCRLDMPDVWHTELADLYEEAA